MDFDETASAATALSFGFSIGNNLIQKPMAKSRVVCVMQPLIGSDWRVYDEAREHEEYFEPDQWMRESVGGRMKCYFLAVWSAEGWIFKRRVKEIHHW